MSDNNKPTFLILSIPRAFPDFSDTINDALDLRINKTTLPNLLANLINIDSHKVVVAKETDKSRFENFIDYTLFLQHETQGALTSVALAISNIEENAPIMILPFDSIVNTNFSEAIEHFKNDDSEVGLITIDNNSPELSYVRLNGEFVLEIVEKKVVSRVALTGVFYFKSREILLECIRWSLLYKIETHGKYYIAPSVNAQIALGKKVSLFNVNKSIFFRFTNLKESIESKIRLEAILGS